jgi:hypothetical protein
MRLLPPKVKGLHGVSMVALLCGRPGDGEQEPLAGAQ